MPAIRSSRRTSAPSRDSDVAIGVGILLVSLLIEGGSTWSNVREMNARRAAKPFMAYLRDTKDSDLIVVFGENAAASLGLVLAAASLGLAAWTDDPRRALRTPWFATPLASLRAVLLLESPPAFRSRNLFVSENALSRA